ncbi:MAG: cysteine methyltransferase [Rubritepida sp.]|nr:cysteine methyltransferase [Rubritepida sp.]
MREVIRYAWGASSLGRFLVATSDTGIVAFELGSRTIAMVAGLAARFPDAEIVADPEALRDLLIRLKELVDAPSLDYDLAIDPRGSAYELQVWALLREIPPGKTTHYGALAARMGTRDAREVTAAIGANPIAILIPCHRVIKKDGSISGYRWGAQRKRALLERESAVVPRLL